MLHQNIFKGFSMVAGLGVITIAAGCSTSSNHSSDSSSSVFSNAVNDNMESHIADKGTLKANAKTLVRAPGATSGGNTTVSATFDGADGVTVEALGKTETYKKSNIIGQESGAYADYETTKGWLTTFGGSVEDYANGTASYKYMMPVKGGMEDDDYWDRYYATVGLETPNSALKNKANATYTGFFHSDNYLTNDPDQSKRIRSNGKVELNANFADGKIGGQLTEDGTHHVAVLKNTDIKDNGFNTTFKIPKGDYAADPTLQSNGEFGGTFYGNAGQEVGGTMSYESTSEGDSGETESRVGAGVWAASQDAPPSN